MRIQPLQIALRNPAANLQFSIRLVDRLANQASIGLGQNDRLDGMRQSLFDAGESMTMRLLQMIDVLRDALAQVVQFRFDLLRAPGKFSGQTDFAPMVLFQQRSRQQAAQLRADHHQIGTSSLTSEQFDDAADLRQLFRQRCQISFRHAADQGFDETFWSRQLRQVEIQRAERFEFVEQRRLMALLARKLFALRATGIGDAAVHPARR